MGWRHLEHCVTSRRFTMCRIDTIHSSLVRSAFIIRKTARNGDATGGGLALRAIRFRYHIHVSGLYLGAFLDGARSLWLSGWHWPIIVVVVAGRRIAFLSARGVYEGDIRGLGGRGLPGAFLEWGESESMSTSMSELLKSFMSWSCLNA
jgi:hypothetical protein